MTILVFLIILAVLILAHELGHFLLAKWSGAKVEEFGFGFPPRLWSFKKGETVYSINWIPFGGFVKILGENPEEGPVEPGDKDRSLSEKPRYKQALVLGAGVIFNIILAWIILSFGLMVGLPTSREGVPEGYSLSEEKLIIVEVVKDSPAQAAGLAGGQTITYVSDGVNKLVRPGLEEVQQFIGRRGGVPLEIGYSNELSATSAPVTGAVNVIPETGLVAGKAAIGISMSEVGILKLPFLAALWEGVRLTGYMLWFIVLAIANLFAGIFRGQTAVLSSVTGPVGLVGVVGSSLSLGFSYVLNLAAVISLNLAVINLLPFPALDGGRLFFLAIEGVRRKPLNPKIVNALNAAGFFLLLGLMALLTYRDVARLVTG